MTASTERELESLVSDVLADPLAPARAAATQGTRVVGYAGADVPVELILAAGALPVGLGAAPETAGTAAAEYLESSFSPAIRSVAELWLGGGLDFLDALLLPRSDDSAQRLYYYLCELERRGRAGSGPAPVLYDLAKIPRAASRLHNRRQTARLASALGAKPDGLGAAVAQCNRRRRLLDRLNDVRRSAAPPSGVLVARTLRALDADHGGRVDAALARWLENPVPGPAAARILLAGSPPPDHRLHAAVESAGGCVVAEQGEHAVTRMGLEIDSSSDDPMAAIADHYHALDVGARAFVDRKRRLVDDIRAFAVDAGILWLVEEDEAAVWDLPAAQAAFREAGVPVLTLSRRRWDASDGALNDIGRFVEGVVS